MTTEGQLIKARVAAGEIRTVHRRSLVKFYAAAQAAPEDLSSSTFRRVLSSLIFTKGSRCPQSFPISPELPLYRFRQMIYVRRRLLARADLDAQ